MAAGKSLAQLQTINDRNLSPTVTDELLEEAPLVRAMAAQVSSHGTDHKWLQYTQAPPGGFRALNVGIAQGESEDTAVAIACKILDYSYHLDIRAVENYTQGDLIARENARHLRSMYAHLERQIINGDANGTGSAFEDANGFAGFVDTTAGRIGALADQGVVNSGSAAAGAVTSVYFIRSMPDCASIVLGADGNVAITAPFRQFVAEGAGRFEAMGVGISSYYAFQWGGQYCLGRLCNVDPTGATGQGVTDDLIAQVISTFPANRKPNLIAMNRDSEALLRASRTATNQTGAPAPFAESAFGIPIVVTDQIGNDETVVA